MDRGNSALITGMNDIFKYITITVHLNWNNISQYYCYFYYF